MSDRELAWVEAADGYHIAIDGGRVVCRNPKGRVLASVPKRVRESANELQALRDWLTEHARDCGETVDTWMARSLPVPRTVLEAVWPDPAWRGPLDNAVVRPPDDPDRGGFLRGVDPERGLGVVDLDGETDWLDVPIVVLPHPVLLDDLDDWRELATELSVEQGLSQLFRETWGRPTDLDPEASSVDQFAGGDFEMLSHATSRARSLGFGVRGGYATCPVFERGRHVEARYWIGAEWPELETTTDELLWVDERERRLVLVDVGPVAFSEGMRMASGIYAGRVVDKEEG